MNTCTRSLGPNLSRNSARVLYSIPKWLRSPFLRAPLFAVLLAGAANGNDKDCAFSYAVGEPPPYPWDTVRIVSFPISHGVSLAASVKSQTGGNWLSVDPTSGSTPQVFTIRTDPARLGPGTYVGAIEIRGGGLNDFTVGVTMLVYAAVAPRITIQPTSLQPVSAGDRVSFSARATGSPRMSFQWLKDGNAIVGATKSENWGSSPVWFWNENTDYSISDYTISAVQPTDAGAYSVVITNSGGSVTSNAVTLTLLPPPPNDYFSSRMPLAGVNVTASGSNVRATTESGEPIYAGGSRSVWWAWTAFTDGPVTVDTTGSSFDTLLAVYTGSTVSGLTLVARNDDGGGNGTSRLTFNAIASTTYQIAVAGWGSATGAITLHLTTPPMLVSHPRSVLGRVGSTVALTLAADGATPLNYQWRKNGVNIPGATNSTLVINAVAAADVGSYSVLVTNTLGSAVSGAATITLANLASTAAPPRLANISVRSIAGTGNQTLILGFVLGGAGTTGSNRVLIRGIGPSLAPFGVTGALSDPTITLFSGSTPMAANDNWGGDPQLVSIGTAVGAFALSSPISKDAALYRPTMASASYTVQLGSSVSGAVSGVALAEIYDATPAASFTASTPRLVNISARSQVGTGSDILIAGFVIDGPAAQTVLVRGLGPALVGFGVTGVLADPKLELFQGAAKIGENDDWGGVPALSTVFSRIGAFALNNPATKDAALLITLPPGTYTAQVRGVGDMTGVALVEVYEVP